MVVDQGSDVDLAAKKAAFGRFMNAGQACVAPDYVLVHESLKDELVLRLKQYISEFWNNGKNKADYGSIVSKAHQERLLESLSLSKG